MKMMHLLNIALYTVVGNGTDTVNSKLILMDLHVLGAVAEDKSI